MNTKIPNPKIYRAIKDQFPDLPWIEYESYFGHYESRHYRRMIFKDVDMRGQLAQNCLNFLLRVLLRSRLIYVSTFDEINKKQMISAFLTTRAYFESAGSIAYFTKIFRQYLNRKMTLEAMDDILVKLSMGGRTFPPKEKEPQRPDAIGVMTLIDAADDIYREWGMKGNEPFRDIYEFLSEFCHPNWAGMSFGMTLSEGGVVELSEDPAWEKSEIFHVVGGICLTEPFFMFLYDAAFKNLMDTFPFLTSQIQK